MFTFNACGASIEVEQEACSGVGGGKNETASSSENSSSSSGTGLTPDLPCNTCGRYIVNPNFPVNLLCTDSVPLLLDLRECVCSLNFEECNSFCYISNEVTKACYEKAFIAKFIDSKQCAVPFEKCFLDKK